MMGRYYKQLKEAIERGHRFVTHDIWQIGEPGEEIPSGIIIKNIRVVILLLRGITEETLLLRASALTFATLLFIMPFFVFVFAFIQTFDLGDHVYLKLSQALDMRIEQVLSMLGQDEEAESAGGPDEAADRGAEISERRGSLPPLAGLADGAPRRASSSREGPGPAFVELQAALSDSGTPEGEVVASAKSTVPVEQRTQDFWRDLVDAFFPNFRDGGLGEDFIDPVAVLVSMAESQATNLQTLGITGMFYVLVTVLGFMRNVEWSINKIWGVSRTRHFLRTMSDYFIITLLLPIVMAAVLAITTALATVETIGVLHFALRGAQLGVICLTFTAIYVFVPNTKVLFRYAFLGGVVAGIIWVLNSWAFVNFQIGLARNTFLYSTFALFPIFIFWIYSSWIILLFGALVAFAYQNEHTFAMERDAERASYAYREALAVRAFVEMTRRFEDGLPGFSVAEMAKAWNVPTRLLNEMLESLVEARFVAPCATEPVTYQPARSPEKTRVLDIIRVVREAGHDPSLLRDEATYHDLYQGLDAGDDAFTHCSITALAQRLVPAEVEEMNPPAGVVVRLRRDHE
jgi:membrane protein